MTHIEFDIPDWALIAVAIAFALQAVTGLIEVILRVKLAQGVRRER